MGEVQTERVDTTGRWPGILNRLGIRVRLDGKHSPCPNCAGKDRFRFDDKDGRGTWFCNQCGSGDGFGLIKQVEKCSFIEALEMVKPIVETVPKAKGRKKLTDNRKALNELWLAAHPLAKGDPVWEYLESRQVHMVANDIRFHPACYESETKTPMSAMLARVTAPDGKPVTIHRTYLDGEGKANIQSPRKIMPHDGNLSGAAVRLSKPEREMGIAEGIETALAAAKLFGVPVWSSLNAGLMEQWEPPKESEKIWIFGDNDENCTGQKSAYVLANRLFFAGKAVRVEIPMRVGDWNDEIIRRDG